MPPLYNGKNTKTNTSQHFSWYRQRTGHVTVLSFYRFWWNKLDLHWSAEKSITWQIEFGWGKTFDSAPIVFSHSTSLPSFGKISDSTAFPSPSPTRMFSRQLFFSLIMKFCRSSHVSASLAPLFFRTLGPERFGGLSMHPSRAIFWHLKALKALFWPPLVQDFPQRGLCLGICGCFSSLAVFIPSPSPQKRK